MIKRGGDFLREADTATTTVMCLPPRAFPCATVPPCSERLNMFKAFRKRFGDRFFSFSVSYFAMSRAPNANSVSIRCTDSRSNAD
eukprot:IDg3466t1